MQVPARLRRIIHPNVTVGFGLLDKLAPDVGYQRTDGEDAAPRALAFTDPDGEVNIFVLSEEAVEKLRELMGGGVIVARDLPQIAVPGH